ncbi:MAG: hypothetical protein HXY20_14460 [Acidobacteria bacterium]|nr:hypothetical protein [Acidobacteriota bacterium]
MSLQESACPKLFMDAYLAAMTIKSGCALAAFDEGYRRFDPLRLRLKWLGSPQAGIK